ncbi:MAG TPA: ATP-binding protein, partial [Candidatus Limnocylindrales bacterium]|nr:ATP-binding protein [Candidatus Limnocylindrales bacterium]
EHLARLVTDLLDLGRIESGSLRADRDAYELDELVRGTLVRLRPGMGGREVEVDVPTDLPPVLVDPLFVDQILANLLDNAVHYAPPPAAVRIAAIARDERVRLTVEDGGPGVPEDALPRLFEKFFRVSHRPDGARRGTGVGLAVVRGLATAMDAGVGARRSELGGLAVDVDLAIARLPTGVLV